MRAASRSSGSNAIVPNPVRGMISPSRLDWRSSRARRRLGLRRMKLAIYTKNHFKRFVGAGIGRRRAQHRHLPFPGSLKLMQRLPIRSDEMDDRFFRRQLKMSEAEDGSA